VWSSEAERKTILDQTFRDALKEKLLANDHRLTDLVTLATDCVKEGMCSAALPFILLGDAFDCVTLDVCEKAFSYVENNVALWTSPLFYSSGKNFLLRMCNDLLRRLSPSRNTVFCGRIQLFLARIFPLSEKSGLNLMSHFNIENITTCAEEPDTDTERLISVTEDENAMEEGETPAIVQHPIDFELYRQFWKLQDCFREPSQCYSTEQWKMLKKAGL
jgi:THO complex subunit 1